jgi:hypothetical protein
MSTSDEELTAIRQRPAYRAALWLGRLAGLLLLAPLGIVALDDRVDLAGTILGFSWLSLAMLAGGGLLLRRAGIPFDRVGWSVGTAADPKINQALRSDFFFRRR